MVELRRTQINVVKSKGILKALSATAIRELTTGHSLGLGVDFTEGEKSDNTEKNPRSTRETNYNNSTQMSSKFFNTKLYTGGHPSCYNSRPTGLILKFSGERQRANRICHPCDRFQSFQSLFASLF